MGSSSTWKFGGDLAAGIRRVAAGVFQRPQIRLDVAVADLYIDPIRLHADVIVEICSV